MKRLLLALLVSGTALIAAGQAPIASASCVHRAYYYYDSSGTWCGTMFTYCDQLPYYEGCTTNTYDVYAGCACP